MSNKSVNSRTETFRMKWLAKSLIMAAAFFSMLFSIYLFHSGDTLRGIFVGIWVPSILSAGTLLMAGSRE